MDDALLSPNFGDTWRKCPTSYVPFQLINVTLYKGLPCKFELVY